MNIFVIQNKVDGSYMFFSHGKGCWVPNIERGYRFKQRDRAEEFVRSNMNAVIGNGSKVNPEVVEFTVEDDDMPEEVISSISTEADAEALMESLPDLQAMKEDLEALFDFYDKRLYLINQEINDIHHKIELDLHMNAAGHARVNKRLRNVLKKRREIKDTLGYLSLYKKAGVVSSISAFDVEEEKYQKYLETRTFQPRVALDLFEDCPEIVYTAE